jgi:hypothetical protein
MLRAALLALLPALLGTPALPASHPFNVRANAAADDLIAAMVAEGIPEGDRETWGRRAFVWSFYESAFTRDALGDAGASCGYMQVSTPGKWLKDATCDSVRKDGVAGYRVGLRVMKLLIDKCGSVRAGLNAYATNGECKTYTIGLVLRRMKIAGEP